jgi:hypothetical protein
MPNGIPSRSSDSGPQSTARCPACDSRKWATLADCAGCGDRLCDECPGSIDASGPGDCASLYCKRCVAIWVMAFEASVALELEIDAGSERVN